MLHVVVVPTTPPSAGSRVRAAMERLVPSDAVLLASVFGVGYVVSLPLGHLVARAAALLRAFVIHVRPGAGL